MGSEARQYVRGKNLPIGSGASMKLEVDCYSGFKADERPVRFRLDDRPYLIEELSIGGMARRTSLIKSEQTMEIYTFCDTRHRLLVGIGIWFLSARCHRSDDLVVQCIRSTVVDKLADVCFGRGDHSEASGKEEPMRPPLALKHIHNRSGTRQADRGTELSTNKLCSGFPEADFGPLHRAIFVGKP